MTILQEIWTSLDAEASSAASSQGSLVRRRVLTNAPIPIFIAVTPGEHNRLLLFEIGSEWKTSVDLLPRWTGMEINLSPASDGGQASLLILRQAVPGHREVFETVVSDIAQSVAAASTPDDARTRLIAVLREWQTFFTTHGLEGLSQELQQGLFGELCVLETLRASVIGLEGSLNAWTGGDRTTHDFQFPNGAIEVKTTRSKLPNKVRIWTERQLDDTGLGQLLLVALVLEVRQHGGKTLPELAAEARKHAASDAYSSALLEQRLLAYGYLDAHKDNYRHAYLLESARCFKIAPGFPRLLPADIPNGIGDLSYSLSLAACAEFQVDLQVCIPELVDQA